MNNDIHNINDDEIRILGLKIEEERRAMEEIKLNRVEKVTIKEERSETLLRPEVDIAQLKKIMRQSERKKHYRWWILAISIVSIIAIGLNVWNLKKKCDTMGKITKKDGFL